MSFSEAEVQGARGAWEKMYADAEDNGTTVLVRMFTEHPDTKSYFTHFKGMDSAEEMKQSDQIICDIILQLMEEKFGGDCKSSFEKVTNEICSHLNNIYKEAGW
ncbi:cytoglobin-1 [Columba guinea]|nr:cytoglobin-1 [Columba guinea]